MPIEAGVMLKHIA